MSPFDDFDLDLLKLQILSGVDSLDASDAGDQGGGSGSSKNASCIVTNPITILTTFTC